MDLQKGEEITEGGVETAAVAMSGGVDSSVAACLLQQQGFRVIGLTMRLFCYAGTGTAEKSCCNLQAIADALAVCEKIGAPHYVIDCEAEFSRCVIGPFVGEYLAGRTPNPCVECNRSIKFDYLLAKARSLGADFLGTGHYARLLEPGQRGGKPPLLARGLDPAKDQSYFLWSIPRRNLGSLLFPLGQLRKDEVRRKAESLGLRVSQKKESQEVCFIGNGGVRSFLRKYCQGKIGDEPHPSMRPGPLVDTRGRKLGEHRGSAFYTVGQRRGLSISLGRPAYVAAVDAATNTVVLGASEELLADLMEAAGANYLADPPSGPFRAEVQVRYRQKPVPALVSPGPGGKVVIRLDVPVRAVTPGQSAVIYHGEILIGGAVILKAVKA